MTPLGRLPNAMDQDGFPDWCRRVVVKAYIVPQKGEPLDIGCMYHNFISLAVFSLSSNIDFRLRVEPPGTARFDLIGWDANELP